MAPEKIPAVATEATLLIPGTLTDFAKALRELIGAFRDIAGLVVDGTNMARRHEARGRAADLDHLAFPPDGFLRPLTRIASGTIVPSDLDELEQLANESERRIADRVHYLRRYRGIIRENCGAAVARCFDSLIDGPSGKFMIRCEIRAVVDLARLGRPAAELQARAKGIIEMIDTFNDALIELHDAMFPPRGPPK